MPSPPAPPEKTVMIATFWPSSRRLAISPPQESATSSGCGATNTWVMARRVYRRPPVESVRCARPAGCADERDEHARPVRAFEPLVAVPLHDDQALLAGATDRDDQPAAVAE